jgi:hypothetical protein
LNVLYSKVALAAPLSRHPCHPEEAREDTALDGIGTFVLHLLLPGYVDDGVGVLG